MSGFDSASPGIVYLVGAGPGDPGLITVRGAELLASADVVVHDRLVHPAVIELARSARVVDVGKRPGEHRVTQEDIQEILVREARAGRRVVRLKGGDPFVFGRGGEECEALDAAGVAFEVVPGISSAIAAPAYAGIPLTHRVHASWAALATGHEDPVKDGSTIDWDALARADTAVFLMGVRNLEDITRRLQESGRAADTPAAVISWGTWPRQQTLRSTVGRVADAAVEAAIAPPAVLVVGGVAGLSRSLDWFASRPLAGRRVFVTRTRAQSGTLAAALRELGAEPLEFPAIRIEPPDSYEPLDTALSALARGAYEWVVVTSQNTVDVLHSRLDALGMDSRSFAPARVAAIGSATADKLRGLGIRADLVPGEFTSASLVRAFPAGSGAVWLPRAAEAPDDLPRGLEQKGWRCDVTAAYRTLPDDDSVEVGRHALAEGVDAVLFTAGSTVRSFCELWGKPPAQALVCCIGPVTAEVARDLGVRVDAVAEEHTIPGLVAALRRAVGS